MKLCSTLPPSLPILFFCPALRNPAPQSSAFRNKTPTAILNGKLYGIKPQIILPCSMQINKTKKRNIVEWSAEGKWRKIHHQHFPYCISFEEKIYIYLEYISFEIFNRKISKPKRHCVECRNVSFVIIFTINCVSTPKSYKMQNNATIVKCIIWRTQKIVQYIHKIVKSIWKMISLTQWNGILGKFYGIVIAFNKVVKI